MPYDSDRTRRIGDYGYVNLVKILGRDLMMIMMKTTRDAKRSLDAVLLILSLTSLNRCHQ